MAGAIGNEPITPSFGVMVNVVTHQIRKAAKLEVIRCLRKWRHLTVQVFQSTSCVAKKRHFLKSERLPKNQFFDTTNDLIRSIFTCTNHIINFFIIKLFKIIKLRFNQDINSLSTTFSKKFGRYISGA